jgi:hypothetical protein
MEVGKSAEGKCMYVVYVRTDEIHRVLMLLMTNGN